MLGTVQITHQRVSSLEVADICQSLQTSTIKLLSLRECDVNEKGFSDLMLSLTHCKSILQLNLNLGVVKNAQRAHLLTDALYQNRSLTSLFVHGSNMGQKGLEALCRSLTLHPNIVSLDLGDCGVNDAVMDWVIKLLQPNGAKRGLHDLILSGNKEVTTFGWVKFFIAIASENYLRTLCLDYNAIRDEGMQSLCVALAACKHLESLDLEGTKITTKGASLLLHVLKHYPVSLKEIVLDGNKINKSVKHAIWKLISKKSRRVQTDIQSDFSSASSASESVRDSGTESEVNDTESRYETTSAYDPESDSSTSEQAAEYDPESDSSTSNQATAYSLDPSPVPPPRVTPQLLATAAAKSKHWEEHSDNSEDYEDSDTDSGDTLSLEGTLARPRPYNGYFAQAMQSTGSGTMNIDSPLHTINSVQYAYSDISAS